MADYTPLVTQDINVVEEALRPRFEPFFKQAPLIECDDYNNGVESTTYKLATLESSLINSGLEKWRRGTTPPQPGKVETGTVTITPEGIHSDPYPYPKNVDRPHLIADLNNAAPVHLDFANRQIDLDIAAALVNTTYWGSAISFTATGSLKAHPSDTNPIEDIDGCIRDYNFDDYQEMGLSLECWMSRDVARVLAAETDYSGGGSGSGVSRKLPMSEFLNLFKDLHGFDRVVLLGGAYNSAETGATAVVTGIGTGVFWIGCLDRRRGKVNLRGKAASGLNGGHDGALAVAISEDPRIRLYESSEKGMQYTAGIATYDLVFPRYAIDGNTKSMGKFFDNILS